MSEQSKIDFCYGLFDIERWDLNSKCADCKNFQEYIRHVINGVWVDDFIEVDANECFKSGFSLKK